MRACISHACIYAFSCLKQEHMSHTKGDEGASNYTHETVFEYEGTKAQTHYTKMGESLVKSPLLHIYSRVGCFFAAFWVDAPG